MLDLNDENLLPSGVSVIYSNNRHIDAGEYTAVAKFVISDSRNYEQIADMTATILIEKSDFDFFYFLSCSDSKSIVEFFKNNSDVLLGKKRVIYNYQDKSGRIGLDFSLIKNEICIYIQSFDKDRHVNYISISGDFRPLHVSNQTGNMEDLRNMALSVKDILVSSSLLKERVKSKKLD